MAAVAVLVATMGGATPAAMVLPSFCEADVLVIGGTPGGIAAALGAARMGASVMLVEGSADLGGVIGSAWLTTFDISLGPNGENLIGGVFLEVYTQMGVSFDLDEAARVFGRMVVHEPGVRTVTHAVPVEVVKEGGRVTSVRFLDRQWRRTFVVRALQIIDATDDGDVAAAAGVPYTVGRPGERGQGRWAQATTLILRVGGVDWQAVAADIGWRRDEGADPAAWGISGDAAWGYPDHMAAYRPSHARVVAYPLNLARQNDGSVLINALNVTDVDGLDPASVDRGMRTSVAELPGLVDHLRREVPGFKRARLLGHAPSLYIRETRHIVGLYTLTEADILAGRVFDDRVAVASYPIDIHPYVAGWTNQYPPWANPYTIPLRAIVPHGIENLLIASRALSATSEAHGSVRVIPTIMAVGQAAGVTAAISVRTGWIPREIAESPILLWEVQRALITQGASLNGRL